MMAKQPKQKLEEQLDLDARERFAQTLREYRDRRRLTDRELAAEIGVARNTLTTYIGGNTDKPPRARSVPAGIALYNVLSKTGISMDWLFGFEGVPRRREDYMRGGDLAHELARAINEKRPRGVNSIAAPPMSKESVVGTVIDEWWGAAGLRRECELWAGRFAALRAKLSETANKTSDAEVRECLDLAAKFCSENRNALRADDVSWADLDYNTLPGIVSTRVRHEHFLLSGYKAVAGRGCVWGTAQRDYAVYLDVNPPHKVIEDEAPAGAILQRSLAQAL